MFHACNKAKKTDSKLSEGCSDAGPSSVSAVAMKVNNDNGLPSDCKKRKSADPELSAGFPCSGPPAMATLGKRSSFCVSAYSEPFRDNIRQFLKDCGERQSKEACSVGGFPTWRIPIVRETSSLLFSLYVVQENVQESSRPFCNSCRCIGWSHHFVSKRRYHMIIPSECEWIKPMAEDVLELNTHLLHGMIHCNGFGHLLCINGKEEGPIPFSADELMDLWDRICTILRVRKITVHDMSKKGSMDLRLLCGVAYGQPWFGKWGYRFCRGSFGVTQDKYDQAIEILCSVDLDEIVKDLSDGCHGKAIQRIVHRYREASDSPLVTISDLLQFMLGSRSKNSQFSNRVNGSLRLANSDDEGNFVVEDNGLVGVTGSLTSLPETEPHGQRWPVRRLEHAARVIANALKEHKSEFRGGQTTNMTRQELRDAVRLYIGDTGLIDFALKHIANTIVGNQVILRYVNPSTRTLEFMLQDASTTTRAVKLEVKGNLRDFDVYRDVLCLYEDFLYGYPEDHPVSLSAQIVFDSKHFVKEWPLSSDSWEDDFKLTNVFCRLVPSYRELVTKFTRPLPPGEPIRIPRCANAEEIRLAAQRALRDTYFVTDRFTLTDVKVREVGLQVVPVYSVRGTGLDCGTELRYEGGLDNWVVDCVCGARDDDGERMVACDFCQVWQHTLCSGIEDDADVAPTFICKKCKEGRKKAGSRSQARN